MGRGGGGGNGNARTREMDTEKPLHSKVQLKGLAFNNVQPAFLRNAMSALAGPQSASSSRPAIPTRPAGFGGEDEEEGAYVVGQVEDEDWDGDEAPTVVVLKDDKHLDREQVDRIRSEAKVLNLSDPLTNVATNAGPTKLESSLNFSTGGKRKQVKEESESGKSWDEVIKRSKVEVGPDGKAVEPVAKPAKVLDAKQLKDKAEKSKKKLKKAMDKKVGLLSFGDE